MSEQTFLLVGFEEQVTGGSHDSGKSHPKSLINLSDYAPQKFFQVAHARISSTISLISQIKAFLTVERNCSYLCSSNRPSSSRCPDRQALTCYDGVQENISDGICMVVVDGNLTETTNCSFAFTYELVESSWEEMQKV